MSGCQLKRRISVEWCGVLQSMLPACLFVFCSCSVSQDSPVQCRNSQPQNVPSARYLLQILGEGKPENQNGAMIFCFGECIQTVDMNQENHLAEAYKMRNLLRVCVLVKCPKACTDV